MCLFDSITEHRPRATMATHTGRTAVGSLTSSGLAGEIAARFRLPTSLDPRYVADELLNLFRAPGQSIDAAYKARSHGGRSYDRGGARSQTLRVIELDHLSPNSKRKADCAARVRLCRQRKKNGQIARRGRARKDHHQHDLDQRAPDFERGADPASASSLSKVKVKIHGMAHVFEINIRNIHIPCST